ncbi:MAG: hypothetical protein U0638_12780 [Phycisphaerales bacterium]
MRKVPDHWLWIGNRGDLREPVSIRRAGIAAVVDLAVDELPFTLDRECIVLRIPLVDGGSGAEAALRLAIDSVEHLLRTRIPTLVMCSAGMSRSPSVAAAALSRVTDRTPGDWLRDLGPVDVSPALWARVINALAVGSPANAKHRMFDDT